MAEWKTVEIGSFLKERENRFTPAEANQLGLKRLEKIDFSGNIHLIKGKQTKTGMILIKSGDLVISGINVEKGAVAVYQGKEDVLATIHYSSYEFDERKIDIEYFKWFLKSRAFKKVINAQIKGGIKTELKPKRFLPLKIELPDPKTQKEIRTLILSLSEEIEELAEINEKNEDLISQLRQLILQDAVSGRLVPQDPRDEPASELLKRIKAEKEKLVREKKIKKEKQLPPITEEEKPYALPKGWEWTRLSEIGAWGSGSTPNRNNPAFFKNGTHLWLKTGELKDSHITDSEEKITDLAIEKGSFRFNQPGDILIAMYGATIGKLGVLNVEAVTNQACCGCTPRKGVSNRYLFYFLLAIRPNFISQGAGGAQPNISKEKICKTIFSLPPLSEQRRIVAKVDELMKLCDELEAKIKENQRNSELLLHAILREAFEKA